MAVWHHLNLEQMRRGLVGLARPRTRPRALAAAAVDGDDFVVLRGRGDGGRRGVERGGRRGRVVRAPLPPLLLRGPFPLRSLQAIAQLFHQHEIIFQH